METLKNGGFGGATMYSAADLKDLSAAEMERKVKMTIKMSLPLPRMSLF